MKVYLFMMSNLCNRNFNVLQIQDIRREKVPNSSLNKNNMLCYKLAIKKKIKLYVEILYFILKNKITHPNQIIMSEFLNNRIKDESFFILLGEYSQNLKV